ncbi:hypothetical protein BEL04_17950 [Mucilaginibacter sp. PPCGB 2223]|uniref:hypothetical protein n=1 Tax=Mucilaginibacter sp. PPCGB 2223 TaxID=1886027 RepID=UPI00082670F2|nr:hypothetical protein [Mucilaginibacter sp. PPCGB 2223]OCX51887.1 hypothetical protein BEL04_17950 [Mucilaginibacter sp. PPCGB 2223]
MKKLLLPFFMLAGCAAFSQTVKRTNDLTPQISEKFFVQKTNKKIREGEYTAYYNKNILLASGSYDNGYRTGEWEFYNNKGEHIQTYNYDTNAMTFRDTSGKKGMKYYFSQDVHKGDTVTNPIPIGGYYFVIVPMMFYHPELSAMIRRTYPGVEKVQVTHIFTISPEGLLAKHQAMVTVDGKNQLYNLSDLNLDDEYKKFVPGTINGKPVESKITQETQLAFTSNVYYR